ncbi:MAG: O-antigen ligase family protein [Bacteroidales bacterium]|nr:O-antigen ligase family protein [Bacteroidales bacterium]
MKKRPIKHFSTFPVDIILFGLICGISLFAVSGSFINREITPKWFGLVWAVSFAGILWSILHKNVRVTTQPAFLLIAACLIFVPLRNGHASGWDYELLLYSGGLLFMLYLFIQMTHTYPAVYFFRIVTFLAVVMAVYGLLQYAGVLSSLNPNFRITGSFDNPAGFAAALCFTLPYTGHLIREKPGRIRYISIAAFTILLTGIVLSGSRAAITACLVTTLCHVCSRFSGIRFRKWMPVTIVAILIASVTVLYFMKKDSADGRLLIWQCTWNMIKDKPVTGYGQGAFQAKYMLYQADYFETHTDSKYASLADNVLHPFNEYLLVLVGYGLSGLCVLALFGWLLIRNYRRSPDFAKFTAGLSLLAVAVFSFFSYPFKYPFTWLIVLLNLALLCSGTRTKTVTGKAGSIIRIGTVMLYLLLACICFPLVKAEIQWAKAARQSLIGKTLEMLPEYERLQKYLNRNGLFLYNHAAELNHVKKHEESLQIFEKCTKYYNDMDVQMLVADNYKAKELYDKTEQHLKLAASMCPNRFMPLYKLTLLYHETGRKREASALAQQILDKDVKVLSANIIAIKKEMIELIETFKNILSMEK